jgi:hypothetical protein
VSRSPLQTHPILLSASAGAAAWFCVSTSAMGNQRSTLKKEELEQLVAASHFSREELQQLHKQFMDEAPSGIVSRKDFAGLAGAMGIRDSFMVDLVFSAFDINRDGSMYVILVVVLVSLAFAKESRCSHMFCVCG